MNNAAACLCYPNLPVTFIPVATGSWTCLLVSGYFTVILSWIVTMHAEEEIKKQLVDSHQCAWHTANSLRNTSPSFPHKYLPYVTLPFLRLQTFKLWLAAGCLCSFLTPRPSALPQKLLGTHHVLGQTWSLSCHQNHWWNIIYPAELYSHRPVVAGRPRDGPGFPFAQLSVLQSGMIKISAPFLCTQSFHTKRKIKVFVYFSLLSTWNHCFK